MLSHAWVYPKGFQHPKQMTPSVHALQGSCLSGARAVAYQHQSWIWQSRKALFTSRLPWCGTVAVVAAVPCLTIPAWCLGALKCCRRAGLAPLQFWDRLTVALVTLVDSSHSPLSASSFPSHLHCACLHTHISLSHKIFILHYLLCSSTRLI